MTITRHKAALLIGFKFAVSITLIALLFRYLGTDSLQQMVSRANIFLLALGSVVCIGLMALTTVKWRLLLNKQGVRIGFGTLFQIQLASQFLNLFMPTVLGGDAYRAMKLRVHTGSIHAALPSVLVDRATGLAALLFIGVLGLVNMYTSQPMWGAAIMLMLLAAVAYWLLIGPVANWIHRLPDSGLLNLAKLGKQIIGAMQPSSTLLYVALISLIFQFIVVWVARIYAEAIDVRVDIWQLLVMVPAVNVMEMIPISISGVGVREISYTVLFDNMKLNPAGGLALGVAATLMRYFTGLLCGIALLMEFAPRSDQTLMDHDRRQHNAAPALID